MNILKVLFLIVCLNLGFNQWVWADSKIWSDAAELSYVKTGGNTDVQTLLVNNVFKYNLTPKLTGTWDFHILNGKTNDVQTAERYDTELRLDFKDSDRFYSFGNVIWLQDQFAAVMPRDYYGAGEGYKIWTGPKHTLITEAGLNYTTERFTDGTGRDFMGGRLFGKYVYAFTEKSTFSQQVEYIPDFNADRDYFVNSETALTAALNSYLSLKASYVVKYSNEPPLGKENTDTITSTTQVVNF